MASSPAPPSDNKHKWIEIGRSVTSPVKNTKRKEVKVDEYYVVVGFEVNVPDAFINETQDVGLDYGHAFFYVVKNTLVERVFSFGPTDSDKKDGEILARPATPDYQITENVTAFKIPLLQKQGIDLLNETDKIRLKTSKGKHKYTALLNDTCAEEARDILTKASIDTPSGKGWVKYSTRKLLNGKILKLTNPYMWHHNFSKTKYEVAGPKLLPDDKQADPSALVGASDPLFVSP